MKTRIGSLNWAAFALAANALAATAGLAALSPQAAFAREPERTVHAAATVLDEFLDLRVKGIPASLLAEAHGVAIIPGVIKVGLVVGGQRGKGVVIVREKEGSWRAPTFITLTGGSLGWQAGAQSTDVVLVFKTEKSVEGLLRGKFTIGADAAAAAGPIGRRAGAATDGELRAEIYSYSRTRGLFAGVSLDGSVLEVDEGLNGEYYGQPGTPPPEAAIKLVRRIAEIAANPGLIDRPGTNGASFPTEPLPTPAGPSLGPASSAPVPAGSVLAPGQRTAAAGGVIESQPALESQPGLDTQGLRQELSRAAEGLNRLVDKDWQRYLQLPAEVGGRGKPPNARAVAAALARYDGVAADPRYRALAQRPEFQAAHQWLQAYSEALAAESRGGESGRSESRGANGANKLALPPPPAGQR